jgi:quercetin dioxygenase-like cupin family protein
VKHPRRNVDERGAAALYALDAIEAKEARAFETRLATGMPALRDEVDALRETAAALALQATPEAPRAHVRERLLRDVAAHERRAGAAPPSAKRSHPGTKAKAASRALRGTAEFFFATGERLDWTDLSPGVATKLLTPDSPPGSRALLIRVDPGAQVRPHAHAWVEHCYVIQGDVRVAAEHLGPGDYHRAASGTEHARIGSDRGCIFLIVEASA